MPLKILFGILGLIISFHSIANINKRSEKTIPFIIYKLQPTDTEQALMAYQPGHKSATVAQVAEPSSTEVANFIRDVRATICSAAENSDVKVWFSYDANGKILGIGMAAQSGLEITFHCK